MEVGVCMYVGGGACVGTQACEHNTEDLATSMKYGGCVGGKKFSN